MESRAATKALRASHGSRGSHESLETAVERLSADGFIAYPTETVWGLGACADRAMAIDRLFAWKGRGMNQPMSVLALLKSAGDPESLPEMGER